MRGEIERLKNAEHITPAQAAAVEPKDICKLFASPVGQRILHADEVWRELRFSLLTGAETVFDAPAGEEVLLQGVADCCIREGDVLTVVDYKTDYVTAETLAARASEYAPQVRAYAAALTRLLGSRCGRAFCSSCAPGRASPSTAARKNKRNSKKTCRFRLTFAGNWV